MLPTILLVIAVALVAVLAYAGTRPDTFAVQRSTTIQAPADKLFGLINDMHTLNSWSPYLPKDPNVVGTYSGPAAGPGASFAFAGNKDVGKGSLTITGSQAPSQVDLQLTMVEPFDGRNAIRFTLQPQADNSTQVTWGMHGPSPYIAKLIGLFVNMDNMVGKDFEVGLSKLKTLAEKT